MGAAEKSRQYLCAAVVHLYDPNYLRRAPLITGLHLDRRSDAPLAWQNALIDAIDSVGPPPDVSQESCDCRALPLLYYHCVRQLDRKELAG